MIKIRRDDINHSIGSHWKIQERIGQHLPHEIVFSNNLQHIAYFGLQTFERPDLPVDINDTQSIRQACTDLLHAMGTYDSDALYRNMLKKKEATEPISDFVTYAVGFKRLPCHTLVELELLVRKNLKELEELIARYENEPVVIKWRATSFRRNTHDVKVILDFYDRCKTERDIIVKYLTNGIEQRAVAKARHDEPFADLTSRWYEAYWDRPYRWWQTRTKEFFDYKCINTCRHRLNEVDVTEIPDMEELYRTGDMDAFYTKLNEDLSPQAIFHQIFSYYLPHLPKVAARKPVIEELQDHFQSGKWYGFTALALTQVEGIFSDILHVIYPGKPYASLSKKVDALRPFYSYDERAMDYFEYQLPYLRNGFLHSGNPTGKNFRYISLDLLYDLHYLMFAFLMIKDPHIQLHKLIKQGSLEFVRGIQSFSELFMMVEKVKRRCAENPGDVELQEVMESWNVFQRDNICISEELPYYLTLAGDNFASDVAQIFTKIAHYTGDLAERIDFNLLSMQEIADNRAAITAALTQVKEEIADDVEQVYSVNYFLRHYKEFLTACTQELHERVWYVKTQHKDLIGKLNIVWQILQS